ncbi:MAG: polynucleotide adenylyltransferase PcnB [Pseudomonadales bacterium]|nr:polynucleotide adenylyltransferase PcnB [Pseudomonadales bacterium]
MTVDSRELLPIDRISVNAQKVVKRLVDSGFEAYVVGGCVRDLLLGKSPKDYDVATNAHPEEVRDLFRNSRLVGRRFRIVHVRFGADIVEVATFRAPHNEAETELHYSEGGMILSDNIYGNFSEDALRRDFTMNALYYQPETETLLDEVGGIEDIKARRIRLIGDPDSRFREDPVRMLRAIRFRAKLGFDIDPDTDRSLRRLGHLLADIPPARLFEETLKLFMNGHGEASFRELVEHDLFGWLFPATRHVLDAEGSTARTLITLALASTDRRVLEDKPVTPAFVLAAFLWHPFLAEMERLASLGMPPAVASHEAATNVIAGQQSIVSLPRRFSGPMREIWQLQSRLPNRQPRKAEATLRHKRFRAAYDFLVLREEAGEDLDGLGAWWTEYQESDPEARAVLAKAAGGSGRRRKRKRRRH